MSQFIQLQDHVMVLADYHDPAAHRHLASHLVLSLDGMMDWQVEEEHVSCEGIVIGPNVRHTGSTGAGRSLIFLFTEVSNYAVSLHRTFLNGRNYALLDRETADRARALYTENQNRPEQADHAILSACGLDNQTAQNYDSRIRETLNLIEQMETVPPGAVGELAGRVFLSPSRLSHLFRCETGMTLHSYLALEKLRKTYRYFREGRSLTDSALLAGFDSSSHCATTCRMMFGISIRDVQRTIERKE